MKADGKMKPSSLSPEYMAWEAMKQRCGNPKAQSYRHYGGRGIRVCDAWRESFQAFFNDVGLKPTPSHSLDRKDTNGNYEPGNVRWATVAEQQNNRTDTIRVVYRGTEMSFKEAWALAGRLIPYRSAISRFRTGWSLERSIETPASKAHSIAGKKTHAA
jgi:hypothetical protein